MAIVFKYSEKSFIYFTNRYISIPTKSMKKGAKREGERKRWRVGGEACVPHRYKREIMGLQLEK